MSSYHTQWAGAFAIAAELSRRLYTVAFTLGNAPPPAFDLVCVAPSGRPFTVEAKGTASPNFVRTGKRILELPLQNNLFLITALLPSGPNSLFRFFVLTHKELRQAWDATPKQKASGEPYVEGHEGLSWALLVANENQWSKLPE